MSDRKTMKIAIADLQFVSMKFALKGLFVEFVSSSIKREFDFESDEDCGFGYFSVNKQ